MLISNKMANLCFIKNCQFLKIKQSYEVIRNLKTFHVNYKMSRYRDEIVARKAIRVKQKRSPPSQIYLSVLGNGSISSPRALYMFTDRKKYLFNCGEGTQRIYFEHKTNLAQLNNVFITHKNWDNIGGLLGLSLTLQCMGAPELTLHGPTAIESLFHGAKSFVALKSLSIRTNSLLEKKFSDDCMDVFYIPIYPDGFDDESCSEASQESENNSDEPKLKRRHHSSPKKEHQDMIIAYACKVHSKPGHFSYDKCIEMGMPPYGPLLVKLKNGIDVTLPSGKIVHYKDVSDAQPGLVFLVVECPSHKFLQPFVREEEFFQYQEMSTNSASLVVHFTPSHILNTPEYQEWINKFPDTTCHLILNEANATLNSPGIHRIQHKLNLLHPGIFNLLHEREVADICKENTRENIIQANTMDRYYLRPSIGLDRIFGVKLDTEEFIKQAMQIDGLQESINQLKNNIQLHSINQNSLYPIVTFLGTGSSVPQTTRNVSAILLNTSQNIFILLDCGEGTHSQIVRLYGEQHEEVLENLNCVFISHMHADHHMGLVKILKARNELLKNKEIRSKPILIIGPKQLSFWLRNYHKNIEHISYLYRFIECTCLEHNKLFKLKDSIDFVKNIQISTVPVQHCSDAHGAIIASKDSDWKIVYSGDTMPCKTLVEAGKNCSVLIHEATLEDNMLDDAVLKRHSTTSQAIKIGADMKSNYTILTHFSQRYPKIPLFNENFNNHVGCAFDNMTVRSNELHILPLLIPTLKCLFAEDIEEMAKKNDYNIEIVD